MSTRLYAVLQRISAGSQFNGAAPVGTPVDSEGLRAYPAGAAGGLFDFAQERPISIAAMLLDFGSSVAHVVSITDGTTDVVVVKGTGEVVNIEDRVIILPVGWKLKVVTTGATNAMEAMVMFEGSRLGI